MPPSPKGYSKFIRTVKKTISDHRMFQPNDSVLVGVSGGPDSVALVHVLNTIASDFPLSLSMAHLNHGLRQEAADEDAAFVSELARQLNLILHARTVDVAAYRRRHRLSTEDAGRRLRYGFFEDLARQYGFAKIALGHHADDNAESVLMHVLRGTGPLGLSGIPPVRDGWIVRPFIHTTRSEIRTFLSENRYPYVTDASNSDMRYVRNKIRHALLPYIKRQYNPEIVGALNRLACVSADEEKWIDEWIEPVFKSLVAFESPGRLALSTTSFSDIHHAAKRRLLRKAVRTVKGDLKRLLLVHVEAMINLLETGPSDGHLDLPDGIAVYRRGACLYIERSSDRTPSAEPDARSCQGKNNGRHFTHRIQGPGSVTVPEAGMRIQFSEMSVSEIPDLRNTGHHLAFFDMNRIHFPLELRNIRPGDRFTPLGMTGTQKIKKFFINIKIPRQARATCPVLLSDNKIIWLVGHRIDDAVKITASTRKVLKSELFID